MWFFLGPVYNLCNEMLSFGSMIISKILPKLILLESQLICRLTESNQAGLNSLSRMPYKTQGLTLPEVSLHLDDLIFSSDQTYIALSRCKRCTLLLCILRHLSLTEYD